MASEAVRWILAGALAGIALAWAAARAIESQLFGVTAADRASWIVSLVTLAIVLFIAVLRPALRASRVDPVTALRAE